MKIQIFIPSSRNSWKLQVGRAIFFKKSAESVISHLETSVKSQKGSTTKVSLKNEELPLEEINGGIYARKTEMLFAVVCFLEDYLPAEYRKRKLKKYAPRL